MRVTRPVRRADRRNEPGAIPVSRSGPTLHHREEWQLLRGNAGGEDERVHRPAGPALEARRSGSGRSHRVLNETQSSSAQRTAGDDASHARLGPGQRDGPACERHARHIDTGLLRRAHSPWQRPSNEDTDYLPKGTEIPDVQPYITTTAEAINSRSPPCAWGCWGGRPCTLCPLVIPDLPKPPFSARGVARNAGTLRCTTRGAG